MRVVGGIWKGRTIEAPTGRDTRPTTERTRESIASSVLSLFDLSLEGVRVLDVFAGSGSFGIEMLSRGAASCTFLDSDKRAVQTIKKNLSSLGAPPASYRVICTDSFKAPGLLAGNGPAFDLVFLDPPYAMPASDVAELVSMLFETGCATMDGIIAYERASSAPALAAPFLAPVRSKKLGETTVDYLRIGAAHDV